MNTVDKVLKIAMDEVGYLEKSKSAYLKNPDIIYEKTAGAGSDNITVYGFEMHNIYPSVMDFPAFWCDAFIDWCFYKAYGITTAKSLLGGDFNDYTVASCQMYQKKNALYDYPKVGDQVFFTRNGNTSGCYHTGIVYQVDDTYFYTIEGNTSKASSVVSNGGGVAKKKYSIVKYKKKTLFGRPNYDVKVKTAEEIAQECIDGKWGNGSERRSRLIDAGYNPAIIQSIINDILKAKKPVDKSDVPKYIWAYLMEKIQNPFGVAGLMGNLYAESGLKPKNLQNSYEKKLGFDDESYTLAVDSGAYPYFSSDKAGYGLAQWTSSGRKKALLEYKKNNSIGDLDVQLGFLWKELSTSYKSVLNALKTAKSVRSASDVVLTKFERPKDQSEAVKIRRASFGEQYYKKYKGE